MLIQTASEALRASRLLDLRYEGFTRRVEVHAIGYSKTGRALMRAYVQGGSRRTERKGWRLLDLAEVQEAALLDQASSAPRRGYRRNDPGLERIVCEL